MPHYVFRTIDVPTEAGTYEYISVDGVDVSGLAVGNYGNVDGDGDPEFHGFTAPGNAGTTLDPPNSSNTDIVGITANGEIFGDYTDFENRHHGFIDVGGVVEPINVFLALATNVFGVNDEGVIFGDYVDDIDNKIDGFTDLNGNFTTIDVPGAASTSIVGVNDSGEIVGAITDAEGEVHGFTDIGGNFTTFDPAGSILTSVVGIDDSGEVVGNYEDSSSTDHSFIYQNGSITTLAIPGATSTGISVINDTGEIVGYFTDNVGNVHGFVDIGGAVSTVDVPGAIDTDILGVDASGDIYGYYNDSTDQQHGFVAVPCYCRGTLIRTDRGERPVELLAIGDLVITAKGAARPIKWIGRRSYSGRFVRGRTDILPICIKSGALDHGVPRRDLWISPHHAMYFDMYFEMYFDTYFDGMHFKNPDNDQARFGGVLIEAKDLVNGCSIVQAESAETIAYFHVELETHDVLVAEGAASESFIDDGSRGMFQNAREYRALYPGAPEASRGCCAPRCDDGYEVEAVRRHIDDRAGLRPSAERRATALRGNVEAVSSRAVIGWAQNPEHPDSPVCLDIVAEGRLIGRVLANRYRRDLERAGLGNGRHGFAFVAPEGLNAPPDAIEVRRSLDGLKLQSATVRGAA